MNFKNSDESHLVMVATPDAARKILTEYHLRDLVKSAMPFFSPKEIIDRASKRSRLLDGKRSLKERLITLNPMKMDIDDVLKHIEVYFDLGLPINRIEPSDAHKVLKLGVGHIPKDGSFYLMHPLYQDLYLDVSDYAKSLCLEKDSAFQRLAASLGAKSIKLESVQIQEKKSVFGGSVKIKKLADELGLSLKFESDGSIHKQVVKTFNRPKFKAPSIPKELEEWVQFDPEFRTMVYDRLHANVSKSKVRLEFSQSLGLGGEIAAKLASNGVSLGATHNSISRSVWFFEVEYFDFEPQ